MNNNQDTFIRVYEKALSPKFCKDLINYYDHVERQQKIQHQNSANRRDGAAFVDPAACSQNHFSMDNANKYLEEFNNVFWDYYSNHYSNEYNVLFDVGQHTIFTYKVQKTLPGGGYHVWHCEQDNIDRAKRLAVYTVYLNTVKEGGETEYLYVNTRVPAKQGSLCIFPAGYTHTHRGNPPLSGVKYILTGWVEYR